MLWRIGADALALVHFLFVVFVALGALLALRWPGVAWLHLPAAAWGVAVELGGWLCPLTPWENALRRRAGEGGYAGGFVEHYLLPVLYPAGLSRSLQVVLGLAVLALNLAIYTFVLRRRLVQRGGRRR